MHSPLTAHQLITDVCSYFDVTRDELSSGSRIPSHVAARRVIVYCLRLDRGMTFGEIARHLNIKTKGSIARIYAAARENPDPVVKAWLGRR